EGDGGRDQDRRAQGDGELAEELAHDVAHEQQRDQYRDQGDGQGEDGETDLLGALEGRFEWGVVRLDVVRDVLDHHHRVVDHEAGGDGERYQGEVVQAEVERVHDREGADDRDRHRDRRDEGGGGAAQEQEDHRHHQDDREHQLELHVVDGGADGGGAVAQDRHLDR